MRIFRGLMGLFAAAGICALTVGCAEDTPKEGGMKTVSPGIPEKTTASKPADATDDKSADKAADKDAEKPTPPPDAGSTTGGGAETPVLPKDGE